MKKQKLLMGAVTLALTAAVTVGGTLAYLTSQSDLVTNTFAVGDGFIPSPDDKQSVKIDETDITNPTGDRVTKNDYKDLLPGDEKTKDPIVYLTGGSVESYVFAKITGVDALEGITALNEDGEKVQVFYIDGWGDSYWVKVAKANGSELDADDDGTGDGIYVAAQGNTIDFSQYEEGADEYGQYLALPSPLFTTVIVEKTLAELPDENPLPNIEISACAVQYSADQMDSWADALPSAKFAK